MTLFARIIHALSCKVCLKHVLDPSAWQGKDLRCPVCKRLIAYATPYHGIYHLHVTFRYMDHYMDILAASPPWMDQPVPPKDDPITINWEMLRPPVEPLLSDNWDDEDSSIADTAE